MTDCQMSSKVDKSSRSTCDLPMQRTMLNDLKKRRKIADMIRSSALWDIDDTPPDLIIESLRFPQRGGQREIHNSFLCFPFKKLTAKIYHKRLTG